MLFDLVWVFTGEGLLFSGRLQPWIPPGIRPSATLRAADESVTPLRPVQVRSCAPARSLPKAAFVLKAKDKRLTRPADLPF